MRHGLNNVPRRGSNKLNKYPQPTKSYIQNQLQPDFVVKLATSHVQTGNAAVLKKIVYHSALSDDSALTIELQQSGEQLSL